MGGYAALYWAGFRRQSRYVASLTVGIAANVFFGIIRSALFVTLYRQRDQVAGLDITAVLTYVWILQVVFGVVFVSWIWEFADSVRSGDFAAELVKPGAVLGRLLAVGLGRSSFALATRGLPQLVVAGIVLDLRLPTTPLGVVMLALSLSLSARGVGVAPPVRLAGVPDYRGWWTMLFGFLWFTASWCRSSSSPVRCAGSASTGPCPGCLPCPCGWRPIGARHRPWPCRRAGSWLRQRHATP